MSEVICIIHSSAVLIEAVHSEEQHVCFGGRYGQQIFFEYVSILNCRSIRFFMLVVTQLLLFHLFFACSFALRLFRIKWFRLVLYLPSSLITHRSTNQIIFQFIYASVGVGAVIKLGKYKGGGGGLVPANGETNSSFFFQINGRLGSQVRNHFKNGLKTTILFIWYKFFVKNAYLKSRNMTEYKNHYNLKCCRFLRKSKH